MELDLAVHKLIVTNRNSQIRPEPKYCCPKSNCAIALRHQMFVIWEFHNEACLQRIDFRHEIGDCVAVVGRNRFEWL
jgi:hypothetical protein